MRFEQIQKCRAFRADQSRLCDLKNRPFGLVKLSDKRDGKQESNFRRDKPKLKALFYRTIGRSFKYENLLKIQYNSRCFKIVSLSENLPQREYLRDFLTIPFRKK